MVGYTLNNRSRYKCEYCDHKTYKTWSGVLAHLEKNHATEWALAKKDEEIERLKNRPPKVVEKVVYRDPPASEKPKFWYRSVYCSTCKLVLTSTGIPRGQTIENTPHSDCGTTGLMLVLEIR